MLYKEIIAVCSQIHTKHINTLCGQNVEMLNVKLAVLIVSIRLYMVKKRIYFNVQINPVLRNNMASCCEVLQAYCIQRKRYKRIPETKGLFLIMY